MLQIVSYNLAVSTPVATSRWLFVDESGSMYSDESSVKGMLSEYVSKSSPMDEFNIVFFSSCGQHRANLGMSSVDAIQFANSYHPSNLTCFSSSLLKYADVIASADKPTTVVLFTDGQYTGSHPLSTETEMVKGALRKMKTDKLVRFDIVGYRQYYSESWLTEVSDVLPGSMIHHTNGKTLIEKSKTFVGEVMPAMPVALTRKWNVLVRGNDATLVDGISGFNVVNLFSTNEKVISFDELTDVIGTEWQYSVSQAMYRASNVDAALQVMQKDKRFVDATSTVFTLDERASLLSSLAEAANDESKRYVDGVSPDGYLPSDTSPCVFDLLLTLSQTDAFMFTHSKLVKGYQSRGAKVSDDGELFVATGEATAKFSSLAFTAGRLNVNIKSAQQGIVSLNPKSAKRVGLPTTQTCWQHRDRTIVYDGVVNMEQMHIGGVSEPLYFELVTTGYKLDPVAGTNNEYVLSLPNTIFNRKYLKFDSSIATTNLLCEKLKRSFVLQAEQKVLNSKVKELDVKKGIYASLTDEQIQVLAEHGVNSSGNYTSINGAKPEYTDVNMVKSVSIGVTGVMSSGKVSLPSIADAMKGKPTASKQLMLDAIAKYASIEQDAVEGVLKQIKKELDAVKQEIWLISVVVVGSGKTFEGLDSDNKIVYDGLTYKIEPKYIEIKV